MKAAIVFIEAWTRLMMEAELSDGDVDFMCGLRTGEEQQDFGVVRAALIFGPVPSENAPLEIVL